MCRLMWPLQYQGPAFTTRRPLMLVSDAFCLSECLRQLHLVDSAGDETRKPLQRYRQPGGGRAKRKIENRRH
jgi:hypothetical protein